MPNSLIVLPNTYEFKFSSENGPMTILKNGDYIGTLENANAANDRITEYTQKSVIFDNSKDYWFYCQHNNKLKVIYYDHSNIIECTRIFL